jgi:Sec-independent protein translocase protein TatA
LSDQKTPCCGRGKRLYFIPVLFIYLHMSFGIWQILLIVVLVFVLFRSQSIHKFLKEFGKGVKAFKDEVGDDAPNEARKGNVVSLASARKEASVKKSPAKATPKKASSPKKAPSVKTVAKKTASKAPVKKVTTKASPAKKTAVKKPTVKKAVAAKKPAKKK